MLSGHERSITIRFLFASLRALVPGLRPAKPGTSGFIIPLIRDGLT